ncbi:meiosis-specific kinetochore protein-like isoform X1 [Tamandua tetradactyla]|uniref:meiosis-specific kinetochore protein-like isoform X1 n=1 Tax=Tamandua tetradactyla TaxID=48850 RepID=UPI0040543C87
MEHSISSSLLSYSLVDSYTECTSSEESLSNFPSPELFRGSGYLDWECPKLEEHMQCRNSTLLDISRAVAVEKAPQFSNISAIVGTSSEEYQKCNRKTSCASGSTVGHLLPAVNSSSLVSGLPTSMSIYGVYLFIALPIVKLFILILEPSQERLNRTQSGYGPISSLSPIH